MGVNSVGQNQTKVLSGLISLTSWGMKSPKNPPVSAPIRKVVTPQKPSKAKKLWVPPVGFFFLSTSREAIIITSPYPISAIIMP